MPAGTMVEAHPFNGNVLNAINVALGVFAILTVGGLMLLGVQATSPLLDSLSCAAAGFAAWKFSGSGLQEDLRSVFVGFALLLSLGAVGTAVSGYRRNVRDRHPTPFIGGSRIG